MVRNNSSLSLELRAVVYREGDFYLAHCLETDLVVEGDSPEDAVRALIKLQSSQIEYALEHQDVTSIFRAAPPEYWNLYAQAKPRRSPKMALPVARFDAREVVFN